MLRHRCNRFQHRQRLFTISQPGPNVVRSSQSSCWAGVKSAATKKRERKKKTITIKQTPSQSVLNVTPAYMQSSFVACRELACRNKIPLPSSPSYSILPIKCLCDAHSIWLCKRYNPNPNRGPKVRFVDFALQRRAGPNDFTMMCVPQQKCVLFLCMFCDVVCCFKIYTHKPAHTLRTTSTQDCSQRYNLTAT